MGKRIAGLVAATIMASPANAGDTTASPQAQFQFFKRETPFEHADRLLKEAKQCDTDAAEKFAKATSDLADSIAAAAFDKCPWESATSELLRAYYEACSHDCVMLYHELNGMYGMDVRRAEEMKRLRLLVLETRSK